LLAPNHMLLGESGQSHPLSRGIALTPTLLSTIFRYNPNGFTPELKRCDYVLKLGSTDLAAGIPPCVRKSLQENQEEQVLP